MAQKQERAAVTATRHVAIAVAFLACAIVLGGGGSPNPGTELLLQLAFVALALLWLWVPTPDRRVPLPHSRAFWAICALVVILPLVQLVPLPPGLWTALAGQEDRAAALALVDREQAWQPASRSPARTLAALLATIPALFAFLVTAALDARGRYRLAGAIAVLACLAALLGAVQVSLGAAAPYLYAENHPTLTGFQANRNAAADVLLIGIAAAAAFLAPSLAPSLGPADNGRTHAPGIAWLADRRAAGLALSGLLVVLSFAVILTASRTGIALLVPVILGVWLMLRPELADLGRWRLLPPAAAALGVVALAWWAVQGGNTALGTVAERFAFADDARRELWRDGWFAMTQAWPFGVGMGGGQSALIAAERLEVLVPSVPNRVHNDYLELALEGGIAALGLLAAIAVLLARSAWRSWRERVAERPLTAMGVIVLMIAAAHSFVDYPLRSVALACLIGTGAGLLMSTPRQSASDEPSA